MKRARKPCAACGDPSAVLVLTEVWGEALVRERKLRNALLDLELRLRVSRLGQKQLHALADRARAAATAD